jgi:hypothetical protein
MAGVLSSPDSMRQDHSRLLTVKEAQPAKSRQILTHYEAQLARTGFGALAETKSVEPLSELVSQIIAPEPGFDHF